LIIYNIFTDINNELNFNKDEKLYTSKELKRTPVKKFSGSTADNIVKIKVKVEGDIIAFEDELDFIEDIWYFVVESDKK